MSDIYLNILMSATGAPGVTNAIQSVKRALGAEDGLVGALVGVGVVAAGAAIALGVTAVKAAGDFQGAMLNLESHAGLASSQVDTVNKALLAMGPAVGKGPTELATALYPVLSGLSGMTDQTQKTQLALTELNDAAKSVAGTQTDTTTVTNAATAAFNAFGMQTNDNATNISRMNNLFDVMNATVSAGNMQWSNYATKIGDLASKASQSDVSFTEANAALAVFTNSGQSVDLAGTHLGSLFQSLALDTDKFAKRARGLGETFDPVKFKTLDLADKLKYLDDMTGHDEGKLKAILGNKTLVATFESLNNHMGDYETTLKGLDNAQGSTEKSFETASSGFNFAMQKLQASGQALFIAIGEKLLPILTLFVNNALIPATQWITNLFTGAQPLSGSMSNIANILNTEFGPSLQNIVNLIAGQYIQMFQFAVEETKQLASWFQSTLVPALKEAEPGFMNLAHVVLDQLIPAFIAIRGVVIDVVEHAIKTIGPIIGEVLPYFVKFEGFMANMNAEGLKVMIPLIVQAVKAWGEFAKGIMDREAPIIKNVLGAIIWNVQMLYNTWMAVWPVLGPIVRLVFAEIQGTVQFWWSFLSGIFNIVFDILGGQWGKAWEDAGAMFKGMFAGIQTFLAGWWQFLVTLLTPIGKWMADRFTDAANGIKSAFSAIGSWFHDRFTEAYNSITGIFKNIGHWFMDRWNDIVNGFKWLYDHNYYFKNLVDFIHNVFDTVINWLKSAWTAVSSWLVGAWNNIVSFAHDIWTKVSNAVRDGWNASVAFVHDIWIKIADLFASAWNNWIVGPLTSLWRNVSGFFANAWNNYVAGPIGSFFNNLSNTIGGWANNAYQWGKGLIQGFINGILGMVNNVKNAAGDIMHNVASILGFHSPAKEGPGVHLMEWGPGLIQGFSQGMINALPTLKSSLNLIMQPVASAFSGQGLTPSATSHTTAQVSTGHTFIININTMARSQGEVKRMVDMVEEEIGKRFRNQSPLYSSGGIY